MVVNYIVRNTSFLVVVVVVLIVASYAMHPAPFCNWLCESWLRERWSSRARACDLPKRIIHFQGISFLVNDEATPPHLKQAHKIWNTIDFDKEGFSSRHDFNNSGQNWSLWVFWSKLSHLAKTTLLGHFWRIPVCPFHPRPDFNLNNSHDDSKESHDFDWFLRKSTKKVWIRTLVVRIVENQNASKCPRGTFR